MATKSKSIFITSPEFVVWMRDLQARIAGSAILCDSVSRPIAAWQGRDDEMLSTNRLYLVERMLIRAQPTVESLNEEELVLLLRSSSGDVFVVQGVGSKARGGRWVGPSNRRVTRLPAAWRLKPPANFGAVGLGWVQVDVPRVVSDTLLLCQIAAKSDWWNRAQSATQENRSSLRFFDKVWRVLKPRLVFPIWATNIRTGASSAYNAIGYSEGAREWYLDGGELGQDGVANIKYEIRQ